MIADILMPTMDGYELVRQLRSEPAIAATPVIFYTAHSLEREARDRAAQCAGAPERQVDLRIVPAVGDGHLLRGVLDNLLGNAWKYSSKQARAEIEFGPREEGGETVYFVRDNGAGFDPTYAARLFVAFPRLHPDTDFEGTGIGLATVHRVIARHGGRVRAEGAPGQGATFYFTLGRVGQDPAGPERAT